MDGVGRLILWPQAEEILRLLAAALAGGIIGIEAGWR
jgi:uncharacterized membrane protein YhiD involved in acid resistance